MTVLFRFSTSQTAQRVVSGLELPQENRIEDPKQVRLRDPRLLQKILKIEATIDGDF